MMHAGVGDAFSYGVRVWVMLLVLVARYWYKRGFAWYYGRC